MARSSSSEIGRVDTAGFPAQTAYLISEHWLLDARSKIAAWLRKYNENGPHTALGWLTSRAFGIAAVERIAE